MVKKKAKRSVKKITKRKGQSNISTKKRNIEGVKIPKGYYLKAGKLHKYNIKKDAAIKSKRVRKKGYAAWRGDAKGSNV